MPRKNPKLKKKYPSWNNSWQSSLEDIAVRASSSAVLTYEDVRTAEGLFQLLGHKNQMSEEVMLLMKVINSQYALDRDRAALDNHYQTTKNSLHKPQL